MKPLLKIMLILALAFASTFIILKSTGLITVEKIELWLEMAKNADPIWVALIVAGLLFADLFIAVPTLTTMILGGFFLGPIVGAIAGIVGLLLAGTCGYGISRRYGDLLINFLIKDPEKRTEAIQTFRKHGAIVILLSRATPILPEVSACMAGMTRMPFFKFLSLWLISTVPYAIIAAYAGSISTLEEPKPAILTAIGLTAFFWVGWLIFRKFKKWGGVNRIIEDEGVYAPYYRGQNEFASARVDCDVGDLALNELLDYYQTITDEETGSCLYDRTMTY